MIDISKKRILTLDEVSEYTGFKKSYLNKLCQNGKLKYSKPLGKKIFVDREWLEDFLASGKQKKQQHENV